jgi:hypothetical protein
MNKKLYSLYEYLKQNNLCSEASGVYSLYKSAGDYGDFEGCGEQCGSEAGDYLLKDNPYHINLKITKGLGPVSKTVELMPTIEGPGVSHPKGVSFKKKLDKPFDLKFKFTRGSNTNIDNLCNKEDVIKEGLKESMERDFLNENQDLKHYIDSISLSSYSCSSADETISATFKFNPKPGLENHSICLCINASDGASLNITAYKHPSNPELPAEAVADTDQHDGADVKTKDQLAQDDTVDDDMEGIIALSDGVMIKAGCPADNDNCADPLFNVDVDELYDLYIGEDNLSYRNQYIRNEDGVLERRNQNYILSAKQQPMDILTGETFKARRDLIIRALIKSTDKKPTMLMRKKQDYFNKEFSEYIWKQMLTVAEGGGGGYVTVNGVKGIKKIQSSGGNILKYFKDYIFEYFLKKYSELPGKEKEVNNWLAIWHVQQAARFGPLREIKAPTLDSLPA